MYEFTIIALTTLGLLASAAFVLTWVPFAIRARTKRKKDVSVLALLDYAGLQVGIFVLYVLATSNLYRLGVQPAPETTIRCARILTLLLFDITVLIRCFYWIRSLVRSWRGEPDPFRGVSRPTLDDDGAG